MAADWFARGLGIAGAVSGFGALAWSVISWRREGPVLKATAHVVEHGLKLEIVGRVVNRGRLQATVTDIQIMYAMPHGSSATTSQFLLSREVEGLKLAGCQKSAWLLICSDAPLWAQAVVHDDHLCLSACFI
jgi:hypothetical protein